MSPLSTGPAHVLPQQGRVDLFLTLLALAACPARSVRLLKVVVVLDGDEMHQQQLKDRLVFSNSMMSNRQGTLLGFLIT